MRYKEPSWDGPCFGEFGVLVDEATDLPLSTSIHLTGVRIRFSLEIGLEH